MKNPTILIIGAVILFSAFYFLFSAPPAHALTLLTIDLTCNPEESPHRNGCDLADILSFIAALIQKVTLYAVPIAAAVILAGGIAIMTAGGSEPRLSWGKTAIWAALIGFGILLASTLMLVTVLKLLPINTGSTPLQELQKTLPSGALKP